MPTNSIETGAVERERDPESRRIAFVGDHDVGKTTVATLVASRLAERTRVRVTGEATRLVNERETNTDDALGIEWTVEDRPPGAGAIESRAEQLDTVFIVATPATLGGVEAYERRVNSVASRDVRRDDESEGRPLQQDPVEFGVVICECRFR